jgi:hypothetical protein
LQNPFLQETMPQNVCKLDRLIIEHILMCFSKRA